MAKLELLEPKHEYRFGGGWSRRVSVDGVNYVVGVERGRAVRIAYKPKGQNKGFKWWGFVRDEKGRRIWEDEVGKALGVRGLLAYAGVMDHTCPRGKNECNYCYSKRQAAEKTPNQ